MKADCLSWTVEEQREIDRALEAVWKPVVKEAPPPPSQVGPSLVTGVLPEVVDRYREQGIPYIVPHPARLYMAHPKWPKKSSEPFDERASYYCERDVAQHMRLWKDAAANKGLVQFEVPKDADLYHPKYRDNWPLLLLSWHEEDASARNPSHRTVPGKLASPLGSMQDAVTEHEQHSAAEAKATVPPPRLPESIVAGLGIEWQRLWKAFQHDVNTLTDSLLHMLDGIHAKHLAERQRLIRVISESGGALKTLEDSIPVAGDGYLGPKYPSLRVFLDMKGEALFRRTAPGGSMEQTTFKGWVAVVWYLWESSYRNQLRHDNREMPGAIRPRHQALGDLRHLRNDLFHNGIAKRGEAGNCEVLRWFSEGERMHIRVRHIFDFLNQMGWLDENTLHVISEPGKASTWRMDREVEPEGPTPALISVRPFVDPLQNEPSYRYGASVAFENGVFGTTPLGPDNEETKAQESSRTDKWLKMTVNERGDLNVPDLGTVSAARLYRDYLKGDLRPGPGIPGPWIQFRK